MEDIGAKTVQECILQMPREHWDYYYHIDQQSELANPFQNPVNNHSEFIKRYFTRGGKSEILNDPIFNVQPALLSHAEHTNSIFFLGAYIYYNTEFRKKLLPDENNPVGYPTFPFLWFLTCLFHDLGYEFEKKPNDTFEKIYDIDSLKRAMALTNDFRDKNLQGTSEVLINSVGKYFLLRRYNDFKIDHGILGGFYLFDRLVKNRIVKNNSNDDGLYWGEELEDQYSIAAATIACHNIWVNQSGYKKAYKDFNLELLAKFDAIKLTEFPFLYLLGIVDTLDPIKAYKGEQLSSLDIFKNLTISSSNTSITIGNGRTSPLKFHKLLNKANAFNGWLDIKTTLDDQTITITFQ